MADQSAGAAQAAPQTPIASIKAFLNAQPNGAAAKEREALEAPERPDDDAKQKTSGVAQSEVPSESEAPVAEEPATREDAEPEDDSPDETEDDAQTEELQLSTLQDLAEATELELDKLMDLSLPVKIDGKESTARLRDLVKSYQLDGHINQKLASLDNDRKTFESRRAEGEKAAADRLLKMDAGIRTLERALIQDFATVDWQTLQSEDPVKFNSTYVAYQQRYAQMQDIAKQIAQEQHQAREQNSAKAKAWLEEQRTLLKAKIPEWSDDTRRAKDKAEILDYLKGVGISKEEFESLADHRYALVVRDAWKWGALQKGKPTTLKKVKAAPRLLKPGTKQSRESRESVARKDDMARLSRSGKVSDAARVVKGILGAKR